MAGIEPVSNELIKKKPVATLAMTRMAHRFVSIVLELSAKTGAK